MAVPFTNSTETPLNFSKFKKKTKTSNLKSFWAFLISIFLYISAFYVFNLSPSTLFSTTKFWFFISNTLILIIAADFGTFSSSTKNDFYEEYSKNSTAVKSTFPSFDDQNNKKFETPISFIDHEETPREKILDMVEPVDHVHIKTYKLQENERELFPIKEEHKIYDHAKTLEVEENIPEIFSIQEELADETPNQDQVFERIKKRDIIVSLEVEKGILRKKKRKSKCVRSNSDRTILMLAAEEEDNKPNVLQRTLSERYEEPSNKENEFSSMSNEELNRRVEEFIQKFNRQIRLQAAKDRLSVNDEGNFR